MVKTYFFLILLITSVSHSGQAQNDEKNMSLLPVPQKVSFSNQRFTFDNNWMIEVTGNVSKSDPAVLGLVSEMKERFGLRLATSNHNKGRKIQLNIQPGSVLIDQATDTNKTSLRKQAYSLKLGENKISITANAAPGLYYGVQTFLQLLQKKIGKIFFAGGEITDWPDMDMRMIYWDDAHHLERLDAMKRIIKQASYYKINAFSLKLEGHFQFPSASPLIEPFAYTPAEYQELTDYARAHYVELVPFLDAPAHIAFILKHPEYKNLRAFPNSNYELNVLDPKADKLILGMMNDLIDANKGGKYFLFSTDEAYYIGMSEAEKKRADVLGGNGRLYAEYITRIANKLHDKGREVIIWGEYPLRPVDINYIPSHIINGVYDGETAFKFKEHGMRQLMYTSTQGEEPLFPNYYRMAPGEFSVKSSPSLTDDEQQQGDLPKGRVSEMLKDVTAAVGGKKSDFMGVIVAGWADAGLNPETFWLGYATGAANGWNSKSVDAADLTIRFYNSFYGHNVDDISKVYQLLCTQAEFWNKSWDWEPSKNRSPIFGYSAAVYDTPKLAKDQVLPALPIPSGVDLSFNNNWDSANSQRISAAKKFLKQNDELMNLLNKTVISADYQHYNLAVLRSVAQLCRQNLTMLLDLQKINNLMKLSSDAAAINPSLAISLIDETLGVVKDIRDERNQVLQAVTSVWYQDWYPRVAEANGRTFLDQVDDVKDHGPARTVGMSYLIYRELKFPLGEWAKDVLEARNEFASKKNLPNKSETFDWENIEL